MKTPNTYEELKAMGKDELTAVWEHFFKSPPKSQAILLHRPLWYKIQCAATGKKLDQKHITKLTRYSKNPEECLAVSRRLKYRMKPGTLIRKTYKGELYLVRAIADNRFEYKDTAYTSLSAVAKEITGHNLSGVDFFGLNNANMGDTK
jgi:hypothetical protein